MNLESQKNETDDLCRSFDTLISLLEQERRALLNGDAAEVSEIAQKKDELATKIESQKELLTEENLRSVPGLSMRVKSIHQIAEHNHTLLTQMYTYYSEVTHMLRQTLGQGNTYGRNGSYDSRTTPHSKAHVV